jgi:hypothetical protein
LVARIGASIVRLADGPRTKEGHVLDAELLARLVTSGVTGVITLDPGLSVTGHDDDELQTATEAFFVKNEQGFVDEWFGDQSRVALSNVGPIPISETHFALETLAGAGS